MVLYLYRGLILDVDRKFDTDFLGLVQTLVPAGVFTPNIFHSVHTIFRLKIRLGVDFQISRENQRVAAAIHDLLED